MKYCVPSMYWRLCWPLLKVLWVQWSIYSGRSWTIFYIGHKQSLNYLKLSVRMFLYLTYVDRLNIATDLLWLLPLKIKSNSTFFVSGLVLVLSWPNLRHGMSYITGEYVKFWGVFVFFFFRAAPTAYGHFQVRSQIAAIAANLCHSHSKARSEPDL